MLNLRFEKVQAIKLFVKSSERQKIRVFLGNKTDQIEKTYKEKTQEEVRFFDCYNGGLLTIIVLVSSNVKPEIFQGVLTEIFKSANTKFTILKFHGPRSKNVLEAD